MAVIWEKSFGGPFLDNQTELLHDPYTKKQDFCPVELSTKIGSQLTKIDGRIKVEVVEMVQ